MVSSPNCQDDHSSPILTQISYMLWGSSFLSVGLKQPIEYFIIIIRWAIDWILILLNTRVATITTTTTIHMSDRNSDRKVPRSAGDDFAQILVRNSLSKNILKQDQCFWPAGLKKYWTSADFSGQSPVIIGWQKPRWIKWSLETKGLPQTIFVIKLPSCPNNHFRPTLYRFYLSQEVLLSK